MSERTMPEPRADYITQEDHGDPPPAGYVARVDGAHTLAVDEHLRIIAGRLARIQAAFPPLGAAAGEDQTRLGLLLRHDAPWLVAQVDRLLREAAAARKQSAALQAELRAAQAKIRRQAGALTDAQAREGRRQARGGRG